MDIIILAMLGGIVGWIGSFFAKAHQRQVMFVDVEMMTVGAVLGALLIVSIIVSGSADLAISSLLISFLSALM